MLHCHEKNRWDCLYNLKGEKELRPHISKILLHLQGADKLKPAPLSGTRLFPLQKGKVYTVNQTSRLTTAGSMASLLS